MRTGENIFKRQDGRWEARYHKGRDASGKLVYGFCYGKTYSEAKARVEEAKKYFDNQSSTKITHHYFQFYCEEWLKINKPRIRDSTYSKYNNVLEKHILPALGGVFPNTLTSQTISNFSQILLYEKKLSPKTVKDILLILHGIIKYICKYFPGIMDNIEIIYPKVDENDVRILSTEEQKKLVAYLLDDTDRCKLGVLLSMWTGLRIGEICALKAKNISLCDKTLHVEETMQRLKNISFKEEQKEKTYISIGPPKSKKSIRWIPLTESTLELCKKILPLPEEAFILTGTSHYLEPRLLQYRFKKYMDDCSIKEVHFHTLRHTFATRCIEVGIDVKTLSEILGHSSPTTTIKKYVHSSMEMKRRNLNKLDKFNFV